MIFVILQKKKVRSKVLTSLSTINTLRKSLQTTSASPCRTQVQSAASFLVCSLIFIEYKSFNVNEKNFLTKDRDIAKSEYRIK